MTSTLSMCFHVWGQTHRSLNWSIFKPEYSGTSCLFLKCNCDNKMDTFFRKFEDCDGQEMGVWRTKRWGSYQMIVSEVLILWRLPQDFQFGFDRWINWNNIKFHSQYYNKDPSQKWRRWLSMSKMEACSFSLDMGLIGLIFERNDRDLDSALKVEREILR